MMAKSTLPNYVVHALQSERRAQLVTMGAVVTYAFAETKAERELTNLGERLHKASPHRSLKTWQNYAAVAQSIAQSGAAAVKLEALHAECADMADAAPLLADWLESNLRTKGYTTSIDDMGRYAKGKPSIKAQERAEAEAQKKLAAEQAAAEAQARQDAQSKPADDAARIAEVTDTKQVQAEETGTDHTPESQPQPPAIQTAVEPLLIVRNNNGTLNIEFGTALDYDTLLMIALRLEEELEQMRSPAPQEAMPA